MPWSAIIVVVAATLAAVAGCTSSTAPGAAGPTTTDTLRAVTLFTGTMINTFGVSNFNGPAELEVGDLDATRPGVTERGIVTFNIQGLVAAHDTVTSAILRFDECNVSGAPFATGDSIVVNWLYALTPPAQFQSTGSGRRNTGNVTLDTTMGFKYDTGAGLTNAVETDVIDSSAFTQFRVQFQNTSGNNNGVSDFVDFRTAESGHCTGDSTRAPILILQAHTH
ncbi:MAG TPA: hypothetical protein VNW46_12325 [Gemmatimonadaceae bacterium]|nr:hypothetical protein [Gemmatimonadaceae bacterium]